MNGWQIAADRFGVRQGNHSWDEYDDDGNFVRSVIYWGPDITGGEPIEIEFGWPRPDPDQIDTILVVEGDQSIGEYDASRSRGRVGPVRWASPEIAARMDESWPK